MVQKYKEIVFGVIFGWVAVVMDTFIDADMQGRSFWTELVEHPAMLFYRAIFLLFGLALGWLLWRRNKTERDFRTLAENWRKIQHEYSGKVLLLHTKRAHEQRKRKEVLFPEGYFRLIGDDA